MSYWRGFVTAILMLELVALAWLVRAVPAMEAMTRDFGTSLRLPRAFTIVTSTWYAVACFVALIGAMVAAGRLPRSDRARVLCLVAVAITTGGVIGFTYYGLYSPIHELSAAIR